MLWTSHVTRLFMTDNNGDYKGELTPLRLSFLSEFLFLRGLSLHTERYV